MVRHKGHSDWYGGSGSDAPKRLRTYTLKIELTETLDDAFKIIRRIALAELGLLSTTESQEGQT